MNLLGGFMKTLFEIRFELCPPLFSNDMKKEWVGFRVLNHKMLDQQILDQPGFWIKTIKMLVESSSDGISQQAGESALDQIMNKKFDLSDDSVGKIVKFHTPIILYRTRLDELLEPVPNA
jgi:hypothetical protein